MTRFNRPITPRHAEGVTLVELLALLTIVALLIALLVPAISKAKDKALSAVCQSNLRNIGVTLDLYQASNTNCLPFATCSANSVPSWENVVTQPPYFNANLPNLSNGLRLPPKNFLCPAYGVQNTIAVPASGPSPTSSVRPRWERWPRIISTIA